MSFMAPALHRRRASPSSAPAIGWRRSMSSRPASRTAPTPSPGCWRHIGDARRRSAPHLRRRPFGRRPLRGAARRRRRIGARARRCRATCFAAACRSPASIASARAAACRCGRASSARRRQRASTPAASPLRSCEPAACPPFLITHGSRDFPHLIAQAEEMEAALRAAGGPGATRMVLEGCDHFEASVACGERASGLAGTRSSVDAADRRITHPVDRSTTMKSRHPNRRSLVGGIAALAAWRWSRRRVAQADKPLRIGFSMARTGMLAQRDAVAAQHLRAVEGAGQRARRHRRRRRRSARSSSSSMTTSRSPSRRCASTRS